MTTTQSSFSTRMKVGAFTIFGLLLIGAMTVFVNDKPYWWRSCQLVHINVADATGLKSKSPIRSLGLEIGYLKTIELSETHVRLGICITAPVEVLPTTRAYLRGEGFLGDKFVELKPVKYVGGPTSEDRHAGDEQKEPETPPSPEGAVTVPFYKVLQSFAQFLIHEALAEEAPPAPIQSSVASPVSSGSSSKKRGGREIPIGERSQDVEHLVEQVDGLVNEMTSLTNNLKEAINPQELRQTMQQLNKTLENASRTLSPEGSLNTTAQRTLAKLEDAIEQLRDQLTRINKGEGSLGMLLNDPSYAKDIGEAVKNINRLLSKVSGVRFIVNTGAEQITTEGAARGWFQLGVWPKNDRYYLLGVSVDPRGKRTVIKTETVTSGVSAPSVQNTQLEPNALLFTAMLGKVFFNRVDLAVGILHGDGALSAALWLGPSGYESMIKFRSDFFSRGSGSGADDRMNLILHPFFRSEIFSSLYLQGGLDTLTKVNDKLAYSFGAGITFDDEDIKVLFSLR